MADADDTARPARAPFFRAASNDGPVDLEEFVQKLMALNIATPDASNVAFAFELDAEQIRSLMEGEWRAGTLPIWDARRGLPIEVLPHRKKCDPFVHLLTREAFLKEFAEKYLILVQVESDANEAPPANGATAAAESPSAVAAPNPDGQTPASSVTITSPETLKIGPNPKGMLDAHIARRARELYAEIKTATMGQLAETVCGELKHAGYAGERGNHLSVATIEKAIPPGLTGGRRKNGRKKPLR